MMCILHHQSVLHRNLSHHRDPYKEADIPLLINNTYMYYNYFTHSDSQ